MTADEEGAKAIQEMSKLGGKLVDSSTALGRFLAKIFGSAPEDWFGLKYGDQLRAKRIQNYMRLVADTRRVAEETGFAETPREVPAKVLIPLIEYATLEDDTELQKLWSQLLADAANPQSPEMDPLFPDTLRLINKDDAAVFQCLYKDWMRDKHNNVTVVYFDISIPVFIDGKKTTYLHKFLEQLQFADRKQMRISASRLDRLGLIFHDFDSEKDTIKPTHFGLTFYKAVTGDKREVL